MRVEYKITGSGNKDDLYEFRNKWEEAMGFIPKSWKQITDLSESTCNLIEIEKFEIENEGEEEDINSVDIFYFTDKKKR